MPKLNDPLKSPVVYLYNASGNLLTTTTLEKSQLGITEFTYEYDDEEEDKCIIRIQSSNYKDIDALNIVRGDLLKVRWGYLNGPMSPMATIAVRDITSKYGPNVIYTEFNCTDLTTYLKMVRSEDIRKMSLIQYIDEYATKKCHVVIQSGNEVIYKQQMKDPNATRTLIEQLMSGDMAPFSPFERLISRAGFQIPEETLVTGKWFVDTKNLIREYFTKELDIVSTNRSPYTLIAEYLNACPYGPWFVTGRGNTLLIHNRNLGNRVYKIYRHGQEPGDLMDFTPETKYDNFEKQRIASTTLDPVEKGTANIESYMDRLATMKSFPEIMKNKSISKEERDKQLKEFIFNYRNYYLKYKIGVNVFNYYTRKDYVNVAGDRPIWNLPANKEAMTDAIMIPDTTPDISPLMKYGGQVLVFSIPIESPEDLMAEEENTLRKLEMETEEANIIIEGDPYLMSEFVIGIRNVQRAHEGNYYAKKCEHTITEQGYKVTLETTKVKNEAIIKSFTSELSPEEKAKEQALAMKLRESWIKQQQIFKEWDVKVTLTINDQAKSLIYPSISVNKSTTLDQVMESSYGDDQVFEILKTYIDHPSLETQYKQRDIYSPENR